MHTWQRCFECSVPVTTLNALLPIPQKLGGNWVSYTISLNNVASTEARDRLCGKCDDYLPLSLQTVTPLARIKSTVYSFNPSFQWQPHVWICLCCVFSVNSSLLFSSIPYFSDQHFLTQNAAYSSCLGCTNYFKIFHILCFVIFSHNYLQYPIYIYIIQHN
jgi:hypothetical protein